MNTATVSDLRQILGNGRFGTITFQKVDGSIRRLNGRIGVRKGVNGNGSPAYNVVRVYDVQRDAEGKIKGWRTVKPEKVMQVVANKTVYDFVKSQLTATPFISDVFVRKGQLHIRMNGENLYSYKNVPYETMKQLMFSENRGHFFNLHIRNNFAFERLS